ncbi:hypothetical protein SORBI_3004G046300, partial [Sorghum bicolor]
APHGVVMLTASLPAAAGGAGKDFDECVRAPEWARAGHFLAAKLASDGRAAHGSLSMKIPDWSKILGSEYRPSYHYSAGELDDEDSVYWVPPHELVAWHRRATSLSLNGVVGRTLKVRDVVWKQTTG